MKTKIRMLAIVMALIMIVGMLPISAFAEDEATLLASEAPAQTQETTATTPDPTTPEQNLTTLPEQTPMQGDLTEEQPSPTNYTLTLKAEPDEDGSVEGGGSYGAGTEVTVTATAKDGYVFTAWYEDTEERGDENKRSEDAEYTFTLSGDLTLCAVFTQQPQADEQTPATPTDSEPGENTDDKSGDTGDGATGGKQETPAVSTFTVTFDANGHGTAPEAASVTEGETVEKPADPAEEGFSFNGWYRDKEATDEWDFDKDTVSGNISLYASWTEAEPEPEPELTYPAFDQSKTINGVTVHVSASEGVFPEGAEMTVDAVPNTQVETAVAAQRDDSVNVAVSYTFDIKVMKDGQECQPGENQIVTVSFAMAQASDQNLDATIYHIEDDTADALDTTAAGGEVSAETGGFSLYTVEFTYNNLEYVLPGNTSVPMSEILTAVGLAGEPTKAVSSAPELFSVEQIDGIWMVGAKKAFTSTETLSVTINGTTYEISVTDDNTGGSSGYGLINGIPVADGGYVWMGGDSPIRWHIIGENSSNYLLISADVLGGTMNWSSALSYCGTAFSGFSSAEQAAVPVTTKSEPSDYQYESNGFYFVPSDVSENMFLLSVEEAETYFSGNTARQPGWWWLRSPSVFYNGNDYAGLVYGSGNVNPDFIWHSNDSGARPAFQLNRASVLFSSAAEGSKSSADAGSGEFGTIVAPSGEAKLTLIDGGRPAVTANVDGASGTNIAPGGSLAVTYGGVTSGDYISAVLCDEGGAILYYASLTPDSSGSGTWNMTLPGTLTEGSTYTLKLFSEQQNGDKKTDYASAPVEIGLTVGGIPSVSYTVTYKVVGGTWADGTTADKTETVENGASPADVPTGMVAEAGFTGGMWDVEPSGARISTASTFTYTFDAELEVYGLLEWDDDNNESGERLEKVTVRLMANGAESSSMEVAESAYGFWVFSFDKLPSRDPQGNAITYSVTADDVPGYTVEVVHVAGNAYRITYTRPTLAEYSVSVVGGTTDKATARMGETVTITADPPAEGKAFVQWPHIDGVEYDRADSVTTTFTMPAKNVEFTPVYADILIPTIADQTYTGEAITPRFSLFSGVRLDGVDRLLVQGIHYEITYDKNIDAGEAKLTVTMKAPSAGSKTVTFKILPVDIEVTTGSATKDEYDGTPLTCQTGAEITGLVNGETATIRATGSQTNVGTSQNTYAIDWGTAKAGNYNVAKETLGTLTVASPKPVTVTASDASKIYGENDPTLTATTGGLIGSDTVNYTISRAAGEDAGTYAIISTGEAAQGNYTVSFVPGTFTIEKAPLTLGLSIEGWIAGQQASTPALTGNTGNGAVTYEYKPKTADEAAYSTAVPTAAGEYTVRATVAETANYLSGETTADFTISAAPAPVAVTGINLNISNAKKVYTEGDALDVSGLTLEVSKSDGSKETVNVTETMVSGFDNSKIGKQTLTVTYEGFTDTYEVEVKAETTPSSPTYEATVQSVTWQKGSDKPLDLTIKRSEEDSLTFGKFGSLEIDGKTVDARYYTTAEGSLKLSVKPEYLETLSIGDHILKVNFQDGSATVKLTVKAATSNPDTGANITSPKTGDESNLALWSSLMILSLTGMLVVAMATKRRRKTR